MAMLTLEVHEPIKKLVVLNLIDEEIHAVSGPHKEGSPLYLRCRAYGGYPAPTLKWVDVTRSSKFSSEFSYHGHRDETSDPKLKSLSYEAAEEASSFSTTSHSGEGKEDSLLQIDALRPRDHGRQIECRASNSGLMDSVSVTVKLDVFCE
ncbi:Immunoglobulin-like domain [Trinorchestia longiramus]|nr:Immunoglobulin-like domain [Trinorchestia longiramus]